MDYDVIEQRARRRETVRKTLTYFFLSLWALIVLFPFYWMILSSLKSYSAYNSEYIPKFYTLTPTLQNYRDAFTAVPLGRYFTNTLIFTLATTAIMLVVILFAAFAFARLDFPGKNVVFALFLALMMIPNELVIITNFVTITNWGLRNTFTGLILPSVTSVFYIYLLKENFEQIPDELYKAAKVDGTSDLKYLFKVMLPICQPTMVTITILKIIECWNSYVWPRLITDDEAYFLLFTEGLAQLAELGEVIDHEYLSDIHEYLILSLICRFLVVVGILKDAEVTKDVVEVVPTVVGVTVIDVIDGTAVVGESDGLGELTEVVVPGVHTPVAVESVLVAGYEGSGHQFVASDD